jgi:hypothetical protein
MLWLGRLTRGRIVVISETVMAMKPGCALMCTQEWFLGAYVDGNMSSAEFSSVECVLSCLSHAHIAGDSRDGEDTNVGESKGHDESDGVIGGNVGIDQKVPWHPRRIANQVRGTLFRTQKTFRFKV